MNYLKRTCTALAVLTAMLALSTVITACNGSADAATTDVTMAQVNAAIADAVAPLKKQIADQATTIASLQTQVKANADIVTAAGAADKLYLAIKAPNAQKVASASRSTLSYGDLDNGVETQAVTPCIWTLTGHPQSSDPRTSSLLSGYSCTGYLFTVSAALSGDVATIQSVPHDVRVLFTGPNCTGQGYIETLTVAARLHGVVFTMNADDDWNNGPPAAAIGTEANDYWYSVANSGAHVQVTPQSYYHGVQGQPAYGTCDAWPFPNMTAYGWPVLPNDPTVTGIQSAQIPGPVTAGQAG